MFYDGCSCLTLGLTRSVKLRRDPNKSIRKKLLSFQITASFSEWCHQESNRGHKDFQSFALPTELWHLLDFGCKGIANF